MAFANVRAAVFNSPATRLTSGNFCPYMLSGLLHETFMSHLNMGVSSRGFRNWLNSGFAYNLQRRYPFRYFTRSIVALLCLLFILFTVFNVAANGFDMESIVTYSPNETLSQRHWFQNPIFTFGDDRLNPKCLSLDLVVGTQFITTNKGFSHILSNIRNASDAQRTSIPYLHNPLKACRTKSIQIFLAKADQSTERTGNWWTWQQSHAQITGTCNVTTSAGEFRIEVKTLYRPGDSMFPEITSTGGRYDNQVDSISYASGWWGNRMLRMYWMGILITLSQAKDRSNRMLSAGSFEYEFKDQIESLDRHEAFNSKFSLITADGWLAFARMYNYTDDQFFNNPDFAWSRPMTEGLSFAKVFHSLMSTDLGDTQQPNLLSTVPSLKAALQSPFNFNRGQAGPLCNGSSDVDIWTQACFVQPPHGTQVRMEDAYDAISNQTGALGSRNATIEAQYTCSVPTRKPMVSIVWTTLLANFVLLQVAFGLATFVATEVVASRDPTAMYCEGCRTQASMHTFIPIGAYPDDDTRQLIDRSAGSEASTAVSRSDFLKQSNNSEYTLLERRQSIER